MTSIWIWNKLANSCSVPFPVPSFPIRLRPTQHVPESIIQLPYSKDFASCFVASIRGNYSVIILHKLLLQFSVASRWMSPIRKYMGQIEEMLLFTNCNSNKLLFLKLEKERTCCYLLFGESVRILFSRRVNEETVGINWRFTLRSLISCWTSDWNGCAGHHRRVLVFVQLSLLWWITTNKV